MPALRADVDLGTVHPKDGEYVACTKCGYAREVESVEDGPPHRGRNVELVDAVGMVLHCDQCTPGTLDDVRIPVPEA